MSVTKAEWDQVWREFFDAFLEAFYIPQLVDWLSQKLDARCCDER